jgi:hypothetical protein
MFQQAVGRADEIVTALDRGARRARLYVIRPLPMPNMNFGVLSADRVHDLHTFTQFGSAAGNAHPGSRYYPLRPLTRTPRGAISTERSQIMHTSVQP